MSDRSSLLGIYCAWFALAIPIQDLHDYAFKGPLFGFSLSESLCLLVCGLINPLFAVTLFFGLDHRFDRLASRLRLVVVAMIPFCWAFFLLVHERPLAGHFVWIVGILVTMFSKRIADFRS